MIFVLATQGLEEVRGFAMRNYPFFCFIFCFLALYGNARAEIIAPPWKLAEIDTIEIILHDQVRDRCFFGKDSVHNRAKFRLAQAGIKVEEGVDLSMRVSFVGFASNSQAGNRSGCVVSYNFDVSEYNRFAGLVILAQHHGVMIGPDRADPEIMSEVDSFLDEVLAAIISSR